MMKKKLAVLLTAFALYMLPSAPLRADTGSSTIVLNGVTASGASSAVDISKASFVRVQVWSAAGATATVLIQLRSTYNPATGTNISPWYTVATITDPSTTGEYWSVPLGINVRVNVSSYGSGAIYATVETHTISK